MAKKRKLTGREPTLGGMRVLITAGPTHEYLDDVRYLGNPSTGRMGIELARAARKLGADATVVCGPTHLAAPPGVRLVPVVSAEDMLAAVSERFNDCDVFIASAAVSDYRPKRLVRGKIKKSKRAMTMELVRNPDVLLRMGKRRIDGQTIVGFSLESADEISNARKKLEKKGCDLMVVNTPRHFGDARESVRVINSEGLIAEIPPSSKAAVAARVCELVAELRVSGRLPMLRAFAEPVAAGRRK